MPVAAVAVVGVLALDLALPFASLSDFASLEAARLLPLPSPAIAALLLQIIRAWALERFPIGCLGYARTVRLVEHRRQDLRVFAAGDRDDDWVRMHSCSVGGLLGNETDVALRAHTRRKFNGTAVKDYGSLGVVRAGAGDIRQCTEQVERIRVLP